MLGKQMDVEFNSDSFCSCYFWSKVAFVINSQIIIASLRRV